LSQRTFLTGFAFVLLAAQACGSDDGKKHVQMGDAGMGGEAGESPDVSAGGSSAGAPANPAGAPAIPTAGTAGNGGSSGEPPVEPTAGAGGEPVVLPPDPELLFSVKPGALGLEATGVGTSANPQNAIYSSKTGRQEAVDGTNTLKITGESLGLAPTDQIVAFALLQPEPQSPTYFFSVANGSGSSYSTTRVSASYYANSTEEGDVYYTDGMQSFRDQGEGGDLYGYNAMLATETSLGLGVGDGEVTAPDDLTGLAVHDAHTAIKALYFAVSSAAQGADETAVAGADPTERGCTVFKSTLDGSNSVAFTCAQLGLLASAANPDQLDALAVYGTTKPVTVVFSVTNASQGASDSSVESVFINEAGVGSTLFQSAGNGENAVLKVPNDLGLEPFVDEIDGLAVIEAPNGKATKVGSCNLTYDPMDEVNGGGLSNMHGVAHIGDDVLVVFGDVVEQGARLLAYDTTTCEFLKQVDLPSNLAYPGETVIIPLAGWSKAKPFENVEYMGMGIEGPNLALQRYDAAGAFVQSFPLYGTSYYDNGEALVYEPSNDQLYVLMYQYYESFNRTFRVVPRPDASVTSIDVPVYYRTHPCGYEHGIVGTDAAGNLKLGAAPYDDNTYRACTFTPTGELLPAPYSWTTEEGDSEEGFFASDGTHVLLHYNPYSIERATYQAP
jgi:hypothetical protein